MSLHAALVHFPIAFLTLAAALRLYSLGRAPAWIEPAARLCLWLGSLALMAAVLAGQYGMPAQVPAAAASLLQLHQQLGFGLLLWYGGISLWEMVSLRNRSPWARTLLVLAHLVGASALLITAFLGGRLVYQHGVGVGSG